MTASDPRSREGSWTTTDWSLAAGLFVTAFISRIPFRTTLLYAWDSVLYTRALDDFDVTSQRPQPPGHIFYVGLVKLVHYFTGDPNSAMVWISVFFSAAAVVCLYWLGRAMFSREIGLLAALLLMTSLSFWAYSEVAYPYTLLAFLSIAVAGLIYKTWEGKDGYVMPAALALALASGFRQDLLPFLLPLLIVGLAGKPVSRILGALALLAAGIAAWYVPSALLSGGFDAYQEASSKQSDYIIGYSSVFGRGLEALYLNSYALGRFLLAALAGAAPLFAYFFLRLVFPRARPVRRDRRLLFLAVWALPSVLFYVFIHVGEYGYVFSFLPAALLAAAWGAAIFARATGVQVGGGGHVRGIYAGTAAALLAFNLLFFLVLSPPFSADRLAARDDILRSRLDAIRAGFDPGSTLIITAFDFQQVGYYLPEFKSWNFDPAVESSPSTALPADVRQVVIFEEYLQPADAGRWQRLPLARDQYLYHATPDGLRIVSVDWKTQKVSLEGV